jgi:cardiolipin synthase
MIKKKRFVLTIVLTVLVLLAAVLAVANFSRGEKNVGREIPRLYPASSPQFLRALGSLLGPSVVDGNRVQELLNGDQIFPAMLSAIRGAKQSITFETYIYWSGDIGREFADALTERASAGVKVHVLLDWVGSGKIDDAFLQKMATAGVEIRKFHKPHWYNWGRMNNRTHRKPLVSVGSTNFDNRSFRLNDEANLNVFDANFAGRQTQVFEDDLKRSRRVSYEQWEARPLKEKVMERLALLIGSQL